MLTNEQINTLSEKYLDTVYRVAVSYTKNPTDAEDVTQNVFLALIRSRPSFENDDHARFWLIRVAINESKKIFRSPWQKAVSFEAYEYYTASDSGISGAYLPTENASVFRIPGMLQAGRFPETATEVLATSAFGTDAVGTQIRFLGKTFTVSGVVADTSDEKVKENLYNDVYYRKSVTEKTLFIPYETLKQIGTAQDYGTLICAYEGLARDTEFLQLLREYLRAGLPNFAPEGVHIELPEPNQFYNDLQKSQFDMDDVAETFWLVLLACFATACIFMISIVQTELFHRRKELGYLQIFGVKKGRIAGCVLSEYLISILAALAGTIAFFGLFYLCYRIFGGVWLALDIPFVSALVALLGMAYLLTAGISVSISLRKPILKLI